MNFYLAGIRKVALPPESVSHAFVRRLPSCLQQPFVFVHSILCAPSVRNLSLAIATMRERGWRTARLIITR